MTKRSKRIFFVGALFGVASIATLLVLTALKGSVAYFYTPSDLAKLAAAPAGLLRLGGLVAPGSVTFADGGEAIVAFTISDEIASTPVTYKGVLPDLFREGQGVIVQGRVGADGVVVASEVLAKHDENYMPKEVADALKAQGRWNEGAAKP
ncbi:MAG: cytochrome c maturation protein CcmE [Parvularculaceae bacterium]|nr:cytochrome c maturation protein CcmE [Parvularculaceae bacterium]